MALRSTQRQVLVAGLFAVLVLLTGCAALPGASTDETAKLEHIAVENADDTAHTVHVLVERNSQPVYGTAVTLDAVSPPANGSELGSVDVRLLDNSGWSGSSGNWTVYTRVDTNTGWQAHPVPTDADAECYSVRLKIENDASVTGFTPDCDSWTPNVAT